MVAKAAKIFAVAVGIVYGAQALNLPIVPLLGSLGIGSLAFAFAAKDTVENFFGSIAVIADRPFEVGDWVEIGDVEGTIENLGLRSTRIRTFYTPLVTVPNATLVRAVVDNYGARKYRRWKTTVGIQYDTPPERIVAFTEGIRELVRTHPYTRKDYFQVYLNDFDDSSLNILLYVFFEVPDWSTELRERERLFLDIIRLADRIAPLVQQAMDRHLVPGLQAAVGRHLVSIGGPPSNQVAAAAELPLRWDVRGIAVDDRHFRAGAQLTVVACVPRPEDPSRLLVVVDGAAGWNPDPTLPPLRGWPDLGILPLAGYRDLGGVPPPLWRLADNAWDFAPSADAD